MARPYHASMQPVGWLETGVLYCDDNLNRLARFPADCVDLIYLDPPFFSNRTYEVVWGDEAEVRSFHDRWTGGMPKYIEWMRSRLIELHRLLKPTGSLYLHCDPTASHYLKVALDKIFGTRNFQGEVIWRRSAAHVSTRRWPRIHDTLLVYASDIEQVEFHPPKVPPDADWVEREYRHEDERGRYSLDNLTGAGTTDGPSGQPWRGIDPAQIGTGRHWRYVPEKLEELDADGRIYWPKRGKYPKLKQYLHESGGKAVGDIWIDIPVIGRTASERLGYPTQKPEALLERVIQASSSPDQIVLDPFCGCGTTVAVAERLNRRWIGIDISPTAIEIVNRRILTQTNGRTVPELRGMPATEEDLKSLQPFEFQNWVMREINGTASPRRSGDMGVDGLSFMYHEPIQVKQSEKVGRPVVDAFEAALLRSGKDVGYIIAFSFAKTAYAEAAEFEQRTSKRIVLVTVNELLRGVETATRPRAARSKRGQIGSGRELARLLEGRRESVFPPAPPKKAMPSPELLVESARDADNR